MFNLCRYHKNKPKYLNLYSVFRAKTATLSLTLAICSHLTFAASYPVMPPQHVLSFGQHRPADFYVTGVATDASNNVYTVDAFHRRIQKRDANFNLLLQIPVTEATMPRDVDTDSAGNIYTVGLSLGKIWKFAPDGTQLTSWGGLGIGDGLFTQARGLLIDSQDRIYVADGQQHQIQVFDTQGNILFKFGSKGALPGQFMHPHDIAEDSAGNIYVTDSMYIHKFAPDLTFIKKFGPDGTTNTRFYWPAGIEFDNADNLFVNDRRIYTIFKLDSNGNFLTSWGSYGFGPGQFAEAHGIAVNTIGHVYVAGYHGHDVQEFDNNGILISEHQGYESGPGEFSDIKGVGVDSFGDIYVVEQWNNRIQKFDPDGNFIKTWGKRGDRLLGNFNFPDGLTVHNDIIYVVNGSADVKTYSTEGDFLRVMGYDSSWNVPQDVAVDSMGNMFVGNTYLHNVIKLDATTGNEVLQWGQLGAEIGNFRQPFGMAVDANDLVYVADRKNRRIQVFDVLGNLSHLWGSRGNAAGQFELPQDVNISADGKVFVSDMQLNKVQVFAPDGTYLHEFGSFGTTAGLMNKPWGIGLDGNNVVYVGQDDNGRIEKFVYPIIHNVFGPDHFADDGRPYFTLTRDFSNGDWLLKWAGGGTRHAFEGTLSTSTGFISANPENFETNDSFQNNGTQIQFTSFASTWIDAIRFRPNAGDTLTFNLMIDGVHRHSRVFVGNDLQPMVTMPTQILSSDSLLADDKPIYVAGTDFGFYLWKVGTSWKIRWSGNGTKQTFSGQLATDSGFTNIIEKQWEAGADTWSVAGNLISFNGRAGTGQDGLNFDILNNDELRLKLFVDGQPVNPADVHIGINGDSPSTMPAEIKY